ncbi:MAG: glutamate--cysteine ligase [Actinomycetota bacterium]|nr:glutamate--cysteine ligase [Actinomycetota bacterium]
MNRASSPGALARTVGAEEEFLLVHPDGRLAEQGDAVTQGASESDGGGQFDHELKRAQAEIGSVPTTDLRELEADLGRLRHELAISAAEGGALVVASGTHPVAADPRTTRDDRYRTMNATFGIVARQQLTCGMHVHIGVDSPAEGIAVLDRVQPWLPLLTALSANSPFHRGADTDYASYRSVLWGQWPTAGPTASFGELPNYRRVQQDLIASGAALDDGMLYYDIRLSATYPTVEIRVADVCPAPSTAIMIAGLARALVETAVREWKDGGAAPDDRIEVLRARSWRAARWGMTGELLDASSLGVQLRPAWACVDALLSHVDGALSDFGDGDAVGDGLAAQRQAGTGAQRQRAAYAAGGFAAVLDMLTL